VNEVEQLIHAVEFEAQRTIRLLESLPSDKYDFRPDPEGRSLGELAWHLAEVDAYMTYGIEKGGFDLAAKPPNIDRPRSVEALAPGYRKVNEEAVARIRKLAPGDLEKKIKFFDGSDLKVRDILWGALFSHLIHHRGQLALMCRLAGGTPPGLYGPTREETAAMRSRN
jgi:uncharacterized damage-inducible protein DinB